MSVLDAKQKKKHNQGRTINVGIIKQQNRCKKKPKSQNFDKKEAKRISLELVTKQIQRNKKKWKTKNEKK